MKDTYYFVQARIHPELRKIAKHHGVAYVEVSEGVLEHIAGDRFITQALEFVDEELRPKKGVSNLYEIFPVEKTSFDFYVAGYEERLRDEESSRRILSKRIWPHA